MVVVGKDTIVQVSVVLLGRVKFSGRLSVVPLVDGTSLPHLLDYFVQY